jgi:hypothetical protein
VSLYRWEHEDPRHPATDGLPAEAEILGDRIVAIDWSDNDEHTRERIKLMREYLRRSALWASRLDAQAWLFFNIAALIDPEVHAAEGLLEDVAEFVPSYPPVIADSCRWALRFATLQDTGIPLPALPDPFAPLIRFYELGGGFLQDGTGGLQIDAATIGIGHRDAWSQSPPIIESVA